MARIPAQASSDQRMIGQVVAGRYSLVRLLGDGGMGAVYKAEDNVLRRFVAIKLLHPAAAANPAAVERFLREAQAAASIGHPNIIDILDFGEADGKPYLVMEYLRGRSLAEALHSEGPQSIRHACAIATHALAGLQAAHDRGILHRDLKPANMMVVMRFGDRSFVKLLDFGFAALVGSSTPADRNLTPARTLVGTPAYAPPERLRGDDRRDPRTDLYSLGVVLYEMLAGVRPFEASTFAELARKVQNDPPPSLRMFRPDLPEALERVVFKALAKQPDDRFPNAEAFANALVPFGGRAVENDDAASDSLAMDLLKIRARERKREPTGQVALPNDGDSSSDIDFKQLALDVDAGREPRHGGAEAPRSPERTSASGVASQQEKAGEAAPTQLTNAALARRSESRARMPAVDPSSAAGSLGLPPPTARAMQQVSAPPSPALPRPVEAQGMPPLASPELGVRIDARGSAREQSVDARAPREQSADARAPREQSADARAPREQSVDARAPREQSADARALREQSADARAAAREQSVDARGSAREQSADARAAAREQSVDVRAPREQGADARAPREQSADARAAAREKNVASSPGLRAPSARKLLPVPPAERSFEGSLALPVLRFVARRYGERALTAVLGRLTPEARRIFDAGVSPGNWLPFEAVCALVETIDATLGRDDLHLIADCGRAVAEGAFDRLKRLGPPEPPPELLLAEMPRFIESLIRGITCRLRSVGRGYGRLELDEHGAPPSLTLCVLVLGFLDRCLSRFGANEVEVNLLACRYLGDGDNVYDISWLVV